MPAILGITGKGHGAFKGRRRRIGICSFQESLSEHVVPAPEVSREYRLLPLSLQPSFRDVFSPGSRTPDSRGQPTEKNSRCHFSHLGVKYFHTSLLRLILMISDWRTAEDSFQPVAGSTSRLPILGLLKTFFFCHP